MPVWARRADAPGHFSNVTDNDLRLRSDDLIVLVIGATGAGKSTFIQELTGVDTGVNEKLDSGTAVVSVYPYNLPDGRRVIMVDTPGSDAMILATLAGWLAATYDSDPNDRLVLAGILCLYRVNVPRWDNTQAENLRIFQAICGQNCMENMCFVTTMWPNRASESFSKANSVDEEFREKYWPAGVRTKRFYRSEKSALEILSSMPLCSSTPSPNARRIPLQLQHEMIHDRRKLNETMAGILVGGVTKEMVKREKELEKIMRKRLKQVTKSGNERDRVETAAQVDAIGQTVIKASKDISMLETFGWKNLVKGIRSAVKFVFTLGNGSKVDSRS